MFRSGSPPRELYSWRCSNKVRRKGGRQHCGRRVHWRAARPEELECLTAIDFSFLICRRCGTYWNGRYGTVLQLLDEYVAELEAYYIEKNLVRMKNKLEGSEI